MARFSRRKLTVELFKRVPNWLVAAVAPFLLCLKLWKKSSKSSSMHHALLHVTRTTSDDRISAFAAAAAPSDTAVRTHITQQLQYYMRKVTGQPHLAFGYAAQPAPLTDEEALHYLANALRILRRKVNEKHGSSAATAMTPASGSTVQTQNGIKVHKYAAADQPQSGAVGTFPLTTKGQLPPAPIFTASRAWKARAHQGHQDDQSLGVITGQAHTSSFHSWLQPWPPNPDTSGANLRRVQEATAWGLARVIPPGETVAIRWGDLREAQQRAVHLGQQPLTPTKLAAHIWKQRLPTAGTSRSKHIILARLGRDGQVEMRKACSSELISAMGVPLQHSVRRGLSAVTENQAVSLVGQSVEIGCAETACGFGLRRAGLHDPTEAVTYGAAACGLDLTAVALQRLRPNMRYILAVEALDIPQQAHRASWSGQPVEYFTLAHDRDQISLMPKVQVWAWTGRCNPYTKWSRRPAHEKAEAKQRAAEEMHAAFEFVRTHRPNVIVGENVAAFGTAGESRVWRTFLAILHSAGPYDWFWQVIRPVDVNSDAAINRARFWYVGVLRCS